MATVKIKRGVHAGKQIGNVEFTLVRGLSTGVNGPFLMVNGEGVEGFPQRNFKVFVSDLSDFTITGPDAAEYQPKRGRARDKLVKRTKKKTGHVFEQADVPTDETDEEIADRLSERFDIMKRMATAVARGQVKALIVHGAPGTGKSFGIEEALAKDSVFDKLQFDAESDDQDERRKTRQGEFNPRYKFVKGYSTAPALYHQLYEYSQPREVLVFDDCDSILYDDIALNLLKAALDTSGKRRLSWLSGSMRGSDAPSSFEFQGSVIFITNLDFDKAIERNTKLSPHLDAMMDRCMYLDLTITSLRDKLIRINQVCRDLGMFENKGLTKDESEELLAWVHANASRFPRLTLRKMDQLADLRLSNKNWERMAEVMFLGSR